MPIANHVQITKADRDKLAKIVGMLGSAHEGERANAGGFIDAMAKRYKVSVVDLLATALAPEAPPPPPQNPYHNPSYSNPYSQQGPYQNPYSSAHMQQQAHAYAQQQAAQNRWSNVPKSGATTTLILSLKKIADNASAFEFVLSGWERNFCADVADRYTSDDELSDKQRAVVERICDKIARAAGSV